MTGMERWTLGGGEGCCFLPRLCLVMVGCFFLWGEGIICTSDFNCMYVVTLNNINLTENVND